jgi:RHS repeat-associated protein
MYYTYTNHLGSILTMTNSDATEQWEQSFDAWGRYRHPETWQALNSAPSDNQLSVDMPPWMTRGYTGHEHLREFDLINMNARMYDPIIGRFLTPDNYIQEPSYSQSYNRYSYAFNNPLRYTDPTGNSNEAHTMLEFAMLELAAEVREMMSPNHWVEGKDGKIYWDENAIDQATTKEGEIYRGPEGWGFDELNGSAVHYKSDGTFDSFSLLLSEAVVVESRGGLGMAILDGVQTGLDVAGLVPGFGEIADGANAMIYYGRGDYFNGSLSASAMIPFAGWAATGGKLGNKASQYYKLADKTHGTAATFNKTTPIHSKIMFNDITQGFPKKVIQTPKGPVIKADVGNGQFIQFRNFDRSGSHSTIEFINKKQHFYEFKFNR